MLVEGGGERGEGRGKREEGEGDGEGDGEGEGRITSNFWLTRGRSVLVGSQAQVSHPCSISLRPSGSR